MRFGLLVNGLFLQQWQYHAVQQLIADGHQLVLLVVRQDDAQPAGLFQKLSAYPYRHFLYRFWQRYFFRPDAKKQRHIQDLLHGVEVIGCKPQVSGPVEYIPEEVVKRVGELAPDFLLRFGFNILRGGILDAARFGLWSFHHDDEQLIRGGPPGFWEVFHKHEVNGVMLQRLTDKLDAGLILAKIWLPVTGHSYKAHLDSLLKESAFMPAQVCRRIALNGFSAAPPAKTGKLFRNPSNLRMLQFFLRMPFRRLMFHLRQLWRHESWCIGLSRIPAGNPAGLQMAAPTPVQWLVHPDKAQYYADPFVVEYHGETIVLAEHFDYRSGRGSLVSIKVNDNFEVQEVKAPDGMHRSFPYLFVHQGKLYCLPECYQSGRITLFEFDTERNCLQHPVKLLSGVEALDPVLFPHRGLWWLMFSRKNLPGVQLFAWYADSPFGPFSPHPLNPVKTDPRSARNAGAPFVHNGQLYRPAQDVAGSYGKAVLLQRVDCLSPHDYSETEAGRIEALPQWRFNRGLHTFNRAGTIAVFDAKRFIFSLAGLRHVWKLKTRKLR
ncbi:MAG: hypothetical protein IPM52_00080 [Bacteroidetes bacterium]|nr:hypothetical protein [Bacteroidota bacterium]